VVGLAYLSKDDLTFESLLLLITGAA